MAIAIPDDMLIGVDDAARMTLMNPFTGAPCVDRETGVDGWIDVLSDTSNAGAAYLRAHNNRIMARGARPATDEEYQFDLGEKAASVITGWSLVAPNGTAFNLVFSSANARELFANRKARWIRDQVLTFTANLGNYPQTISPDSSPAPDTSSGSTAA